MHANKIKMALNIKRIVDEYYEPNSQRGSLIDVYRRKVYAVYPMSEGTFYRLIEIAIGIDGYIGNGANRVERKKRKLRTDSEDKRQLRLFDDY